MNDIQEIYAFIGWGFSFFSGVMVSGAVIELENSIPLSLGLFAVALGSGVVGWAWISDAIEHDTSENPVGTSSREVIEVEVLE